MTGARDTAPEHAASGTLPPLEMWAGVECTINRVGNEWRDQLAMAGHYARPNDVALIASLGVRAVRWPVLWERHAANATAWKHTERVLRAFRKHGIRVIVGLVHHGSGPLGTDLLDEQFAPGLAKFAREVAQRFPWIDAWTPVNEPLTTARFAALYGLWYPHLRRDAAFIRATVNQVRATQAAMAAVQSVNPRSQLIATEDLGYTHVNPALRYQAAFENERRWLTWDLLQGEVRRGHPLWNWLVRNAPVRGVLDAVAEAARNSLARCAVIGVNHYVTSERFLDEELAYYPAHVHGGNRWHRYADVEAVRVLRDGLLGPERLIEQAWRRYGVPVAITESHLGCTREQQMRWLADVWQAAQAARHKGAHVIAVTPWALFGSFDWGSLLTRTEYRYESGAWDVRAPVPRPTALAPMIRALATCGSYEHPALEAEAWWKRADRLLYPPRRGVLARESGADTSKASTTSAPRSPSASLSRRPLLIVGAAGALGSAFERLAALRGLHAVALTRSQLDITDHATVAKLLDAVRPWAIVNAAGWVRVDDAERERDACLRANVLGAEVLARAAASRDLPYCTFSSDLVFGNSTSRPFVESDATSPRNWYGQSKATAEQRVRRAHEGALVVRTSAFFGDWDDGNFVSRALAHLHNGDVVHAPDDTVVSPTYITDLVHASLDLLIDGAHGMWHLANMGAVSWYDLTRNAAAMAGFTDGQRALITACSGSDIGWTAPRPSYSVLGSERATLLPALDDALARHLKARAWERVARHPSLVGHPATARS